MQLIIAALLVLVGNVLVWAGACACSKAHPIRFARLHAAAADLAAAAVGTQDHSQRAPLPANQLHRHVHSGATAHMTRVGPHALLSS
jgi:hypothetical protein